MDDKRPGGTMVGLAPTRLPASVRPRLMKLARRGADVCRKYGAKLLAEISLGLEVALLDLQVAEQRAKAAEKERQTVITELGEARARIYELEVFIEQRTIEHRDTGEFTVPNEFATGVAENTAVRDSSALIQQCKDSV